MSPKAKVSVWATKANCSKPDPVNRILCLFIVFCLILIIWEVVCLGAQLWFWQKHLYFCCLVVPFLKLQSLKNTYKKSQATGTRRSRGNPDWAAAWWGVNLCIITQLLLTFIFKLNMITVVRQKISLLRIVKFFLRGLMDDLKNILTWAASAAVGRRRGWRKGGGWAGRASELAAQSSPFFF